MPTANPKISAYVPPHIFDRFRKFQEECKLSMSQAVAVILSEYFQLDLEVGDDASLPSGLLAKKLAAIEETLSTLGSSQSESIGELHHRINSLIEKDDQLEQRLAAIEQLKKSNAQSYTQPKQLSFIDSDQGLSQVKSSETATDTNDVVSKSLGDIQISSFQPLTSKLLASRLGVAPPVISVNKKRMFEVNFYGWLQQKDPDRIRWEWVGKPKNPSKGYLPSSDTSPELLGKLRHWLDKNQ